jgi:hypothetical protein
MNKRKRETPPYQFKFENLPFDIFNKVFFYLDFANVDCLIKIKSLYKYLINNINFYQFYLDHFNKYGLFIEKDIFQKLNGFYNNKFKSKLLYEKGLLEEDTFLFNKIAFKLCQISKFNIYFKRNFKIDMVEYNFKDQCIHEKSGLFDFKDYSYDLKHLNGGIYNHSYIIIYNTETFEISKIQKITQNLHLRFNNQIIDRNEKLICIASEELTCHFLIYTNNRNAEDIIKKFIQKMFILKKSFIKVKTLIIPAFNKEIKKFLL